MNGVMNEQEFIAALQSVGKDVESARSAILMAGAMVIMTSWKDHIGPEFHNFLTGTYKRSVQVEYNKSEKAAYIGTDIINPPYPWFLEVGTSRMAARPAMTPAVETSKEDVFKAIEDALKMVIIGGI